MKKKESYDEYSSDDDYCTCGHLKSYHHKNGPCQYGMAGSATGSMGCNCRQYVSRDEFDAKNPYAP